MCEHREHRTGNCAECRPLAWGGIVRGDGELVGGPEGVTCYVPLQLVNGRPAMPQLWDGDNA